MVELSGMYALFMPRFMRKLGAAAVDIGLVYTLAEVIPWVSASLGLVPAAIAHMFRLRLAIPV